MHGGEKVDGSLVGYDVGVGGARDPVVDVVVRGEEDGGTEKMLSIPGLIQPVDSDDGQLIVGVQGLGGQEMIPKDHLPGGVDSLQTHKDAHSANGRSRNLFGLSFFTTVFMLFLLLLPYL